jgi:heme A synthase
LAAVFFEFMEALIGAALVLLGHVARNPSTARGYSLSLHLINTLLLLAAITVTAWAGSRGNLLPRPGLRRWRLAYAACAAALLLLGVSGAIAALGDTLFKATSLGEGFRQDFAAGVHPFVRLRIWHPVIAVVVSVGTVALAYTAILRQNGFRALRAAYSVLGLMALQLAVGTVNLSLLAPVPLQLVHLLLADLLWICFVLMGAETLLIEAPERTARLADTPALAARG